MCACVRARVSEVGLAGGSGWVRTLAPGRLGRRRFVPVRRTGAACSAGSPPAPPRSIRRGPSARACRRRVRPSSAASPWSRTRRATPRRRAPLPANLAGPRPARPRWLFIAAVPIYGGRVGPWPAHALPASLSFRLAPLAVLPPPVRARGRRVAFSSLRGRRCGFGSLSLWISGARGRADGAAVLRRAAGTHG
jgi:hypothetical protein